MASPLRRISILILAVCFFMTVYWYATEPYDVDLVFKSESSQKNKAGEPDTVSCQFPDFDPFIPEAMKYYVEFPTTSCPDGMPTITHFNGEVVKINQTKKREKLGGVSIQCWYRAVSYQRRVDYVNDVWNGPFNDHIKVTGQPQYVEVKCEDENRKQVSRMHHYIVRKEERKLSTPPHHKKFGKDQMNIIMLGVDSLASHLLKRAMPRTRNYLLQKMDAIEFTKYNRVGGDTFTNMLALTAGLYSRDLGNWTQAEGFDNVPFMWNRYKKFGYRTQYMSDRFDFDDFARPPTDSFSLPIVQALMKDKIAFKNNCFEDQIEVKLWLDLLLEFTRESLFTTGRFFSVGFLDRPLHDFPNQASAVDEHYYNFFKEIHGSGLLENTFLIFFGDHGPKMNDYRRTFYGSIEERVANMMIYAPPWFRSKYPELYKTLQINANRLTTNFDVHKTVENLVLLPAITDPSIKPYMSKTGKERGLSLFKEISPHRTCDDAALTPHNCMCHGGVVVKDAAIENELGLYVVQEINAILQPKFDLCAKLSLRSVTTMILLSGQVSRTSTYRVILTTEPAGAVFEATIRYTVTLYFFTKLESLGLISRIDVYRGQSDCVHEDKVTRKYCYCKDVLAKQKNRLPVT